MTSATANFPVVDAQRQTEITQEQAEFFRKNGLLILRNVLAGEELSVLRAELGAHVDRMRSEHVADVDYRYQPHPSGVTVPYQVDFVIDKGPAALALLGHPFLLRTMQVLQGPNLIPTWDSMVFKFEGAGALIPWHRDDWTIGSHPEPAHLVSAINVDIYLDDADERTCLWGILGSNLWDETTAHAEIDRRNQGFVTDGAACPLPMRAGDVLLHDVRVLHGSPATTATLRRVLYYEFRPVERELVAGPHNREYLGKKQAVLAAALRARQQTGYGESEQPFDYRPDAAHDFAGPAREVDPPTLRYPHEDYPWTSVV